MTNHPLPGHWKRDSSKPVKHLFLDIDGVLNHLDFATSPRVERLQRESLDMMDGKRTWRWWNVMIEPLAMARLQKVVALTGARIVISSAWREMMNHDSLETLFRFHGLQVSGMTPRLESEIRGEEIAKWLTGWGDMTKHPYAIVDDRPDAGSGHPPERFVLTSVSTGMTDADADRLIEILGSLE